MTSHSDDLPVLVIDGASFADFAGFTREFSRLLDNHHWQGNRPHIAARIDAAQHGEGPTLFDEIVDVIHQHGPGGDESEDAILLELA